MTNYKTIIFATVVATSAISGQNTTASAAGKTDLMPGQAAQWNGFYIGAQTGFNRNRGKDQTSNTKLNRKTFDAGLHAGYNWQHGSTVFGVEVDTNLLAIAKKKARGPFSKSIFAPVATTRLRIGQAFGNSLLYGTGGMTWGIGHHKTGTKTKTKLHPGWVIGAGLEHKLNANWSLRGEYLYHNFGKKNYKFSTGTRRLSYDDTHSVRVGVSYHF